MSLSRRIHHFHSFTRLEIYHHIYFIQQLSCLTKQNDKMITPTFLQKARVTERATSFYHYIYTPAFPYMFGPVIYTTRNVPRRHVVHGRVNRLHVAKWIFMVIFIMINIFYCHDNRNLANFGPARRRSFFHSFPPHCFYYSLFFLFVLCHCLSVC